MALQCPPHDVTEALVYAWGAGLLSAWAVSFVREWTIVDLVAGCCLLVGAIALVRLAVVCVQPAAVVKDVGAWELWG